METVVIDDNTPFFKKLKIQQDLANKITAAAMNELKKHIPYTDNAINLASIELEINIFDVLDKYFKVFIDLKYQGLELTK
jgi:hypothetical protein